MNVVLLWPTAGNRHGRWTTSCTIVGLRTVILEKSGGKIQMLKAPGKKLGWTTALGQAAFILASRILSWQASARSAEIIRQHDLCTTPVAGVEIIEVPSVNVSSTIKILRRLNPMWWSSTARVLFPRRVLKASDAVFINMHAGIHRNIAACMADIVRSTMGTARRRLLLGAHRSRPAG